MKVTANGNAIVIWYAMNEPVAQRPANFVAQWESSYSSRRSSLGYKEDGVHGLLGTII